MGTLARWLDADRALAALAVLAVAIAGVLFAMGPGVATGGPERAPSGPAPRAQLAAAGLLDPFAAAPAGGTEGSPGGPEMPIPSVSTPATPETTVASVAPGSTGFEPGRFRITGVFGRGDDWTAVIEDASTGREQAYAVGESIGGAEIVHITAKGVELSVDGRTLALPLKGRPIAPPEGPAKP